MLLYAWHVRNKMKSLTLHRPILIVKLLLLVLKTNGIILMHGALHFGFLAGWLISMETVNLQKSQMSALIL